MARKEGFVVLADALESLELAGDVHPAEGVAADVEGNHAYRVASYQEAVPSLVVKAEGEDAAQRVEKRTDESVGGMFIGRGELGGYVLIEGEYALTVGAGLEGVVAAAADFLVVVDFAVDAQDQISVRRNEWLAA